MLFKSTVLHFLSCVLIPLLRTYIYVCTYMYDARYLCALVLILLFAIRHLSQPRDQKKE